MLTVIASSTLWGPANATGRIDAPFAGLLKFLGGDELSTPAADVFASLFDNSRKAREAMAELLACKDRESGLTVLKKRINVGSLSEVQESRLGQFFDSLIHSAIADIDREAATIQQRRGDLSSMLASV